MAEVGLSVSPCRRLPFWQAKSARRRSSVVFRPSSVVNRPPSAVALPHSCRGRGAYERLLARPLPKFPSKRYSIRMHTTISGIIRRAMEENRREVELYW